MNLPQFKDFVRTTREGITVSRAVRIRREGSRPYVWTPAGIASGATSVIHVQQQFPDSRKYEPLDSIEVVNNETSNDITLTINGTNTWNVPAGTIRVVHGDGVALWYIALTNDGAEATTQGKVVVTLQKEPMTIDKWSRR
jgi:hypothetical protein